MTLFRAGSPNCRTVWNPLCQGQYENEAGRLFTTLAMRTSLERLLSLSQLCFEVRGCVPYSIPALRVPQLASCRAAAL